MVDSVGKSHYYYSR